MNHNESATRYRNDARFHKLVDMYYNMLYDNQVSYYEIYDALIFATTKFAMERGIIFNRNPYELSKESEDSNESN